MLLTVVGNSFESVGLQLGGLHQGRVRLCEPGEHRTVRDPHARVPRAEPVDGVEGGRPPAPHAHVVRLAIVHAPGKRDAQLNRIALCSCSRFLFVVSYDVIPHIAHNS